MVRRFATKQDRQAGAASPTECLPVKPRAIADDQSSVSRRRSQGLIQAICGNGFGRRRTTFGRARQEHRGIARQQIGVPGEIRGELPVLITVHAEVRPVDRRYVNVKGLLLSSVDRRMILEWMFLATGQYVFVPVRLNASIFKFLLRVPAFVL